MWLSEAQLRLANMCFYIAMKVSDYVLLYSHEAESPRLACVWYYTAMKVRPN